MRPYISRNFAANTSATFVTLRLWPWCVKIATLPNSKYVVGMAVSTVTRGRPRIERTAIRAATLATQDRDCASAMMMCTFGRLASSILITGAVRDCHATSFGKRVSASSRLRCAGVTGSNRPNAGSRRFFALLRSFVRIRRVGQGRIASPNDAIMSNSIQPNSYSRRMGRSSGLTEPATAPAHTR